MGIPPAPGSFGRRCDRRTGLEDTGSPGRLFLDLQEVALKGRVARKAARAQVGARDTGPEVDMELHGEASTPGGSEANVDMSVGVMRGHDSGGGVVSGQRRRPYGRTDYRGTWSLGTTSDMNRRRVSSPG